MGKSADAFRTISEVAELLDTPTHVLRFWESKFPQLKPVKRAGGRRYYRPGDVALLGGIKHLLHEEGMTIRSVQKMLREEGIREVSAQSSVVLDDESAEAPAKAEPKAPAPQVSAAVEATPVAPIAEAKPGEPAPPASAPETEAEPETQPEVALAAPEAPSVPSSSVTPFPRPTAPAQRSFFDAPESEVEEAPIALDVEPEPEPPAPIVSMTIERKQEPVEPKDRPSLARLLHNLRQLDPERLSPADRGDLRMLRLRAKALQIRLAQTAYPDAGIRPD
ncbi:MAG: MerR family transcriptional regulator [Thioclava marina]|uniref:MerR family transcriptional regulator n=1 Tax=Thioclava marina TaxID=1915077 RepID=UPI0019CB1D50|nr:MerR family transcriptional regulator [Thioclava marina]MBC7144990.1 MerR family transcriptional regulator [Thioclava marina]